MACCVPDKPGASRLRRNGPGAMAAQARESTWRSVA